MESKLSPWDFSAQNKDSGRVTPHGYDHGHDLLVPCETCPGGVPCRCMTLGLRVLGAQGSDQ